MYEKNKVSVVMPIYNPSELLIQSIQSVLNQSYTDIELWLVDDGSSLNYELLIQEFVMLENVYHLKLMKNQGPACARNAGLQKSNGQYIAFIDSDDIWEKEKIKKQVEIMEQKKIAISFSAYQVIDVDTHEMIRIIPVPERIDYKGLLKNTIIGCSTVVIDRFIVGNFLMPDIRGGEDTATWLTILRQGYQAIGIQESLVTYNLRRNSFSSNKWRMLARTWHAYRQTQNLSILATSYYFSWYVFNAVKKRL